MGAEYLGRKYHHFIGALEKFYATLGQSYFFGRGQPCHYEEQQLKEKGGRRHRCASHRTDWWNRTHTRTQYSNPGLSYREEYMDYTNSLSSTSQAS
eukprot:4670249-Pyramimonas_sp.AAC.1